MGIRLVPLSHWPLSGENFCYPSFRKIRGTPHHNPIKIWDLVFSQRKSFPSCLKRFRDHLKRPRILLAVPKPKNFLPPANWLCSPRGGERPISNALSGNPLPLRSHHEQEPGNHHASGELDQWNLHAHGRIFCSAAREIRRGKPLLTQMAEQISTKKPLQSRT